MAYSCSFQLPILETWIQVLAVQLGLIMFVAIPQGVVFYYIYAKDGARSSLSLPTYGITMLVALVTAFKMPSVVSSIVLSVIHDEKVHWMIDFVSSCVGFASVFKSIAVIFHNYPPEVDNDLRSFLCWYASFTEPIFVKDKLKKVSMREMLERFSLLVGKILGLCTLLTCFQSFGMYPSQYASTSQRLPSFLIPLIDGYLHVWYIYFFLSFAMDFSMISYSGLFGASVETGFYNPLLTSRSMAECWAQKWNLSVQSLLKRNVYIPCRKAGIRRELSTVLTFLASGLLHEYTFSIHNTASYRMGEATIFFTTMGILVLVEGAIAMTMPVQLQDHADRVPSAVISSILVLLVAAAVPLFIRSWLESGVIDATSQLFPHFLCTSDSER